MTAYQAYIELFYYTLTHTDQNYSIHQHLVDAYTAQTTDRSTESLRFVFALVGLYLLLEKGYTGRQVQAAHTAIAKNKKGLPLITLPEARGSITAINVLQTEPGPKRDEMIKQWCASVWQAYAASQQSIAALY